MVKSLYTKISEKVSENMRLKVLLEENGISYGEDEGSAKRNSILARKGDGPAPPRPGKDKHSAYLKERDELRRKNQTLTRNMTNLTEEYEKAISQYSALSLNYKIERNKTMKELSRKDMELEQMSKVLTYRTIHEGEIQKKLDELVEINEMLRKALEEKMRSVVVGGARVIRGGGSQPSIRGGGAAKPLSIDIPRAALAPAPAGAVSPAASTPLSASKSASCRSFMTQGRIAATSAVSSPLASASSAGQESASAGAVQRRKSFSGLRRKIESSRN